jgi:hypothetical protein
LLKYRSLSPIVQLSHFFSLVAIPKSKFIR